MKQGVKGIFEAFLIAPSVCPLFGCCDRRLQLERPPRSMVLGDVADLIHNPISNGRLNEAYSRDFRIMYTDPSNRKVSLLLLTLSFVSRGD